MRLLSVAASLLAFGLSTTVKAESLDTSEASVTEVHRRLESGLLVVGLIAENRSLVKADISIECAARQDGNIIEADSFVIRAVGPGKKGYDETVFNRIHRIGVEVSCWVDDLNTAE